MLVESQFVKDLVELIKKENDKKYTLADELKKIYYSTNETNFQLSLDILIQIALKYIKRVKRIKRFDTEYIKSECTIDKYTLKDDSQIIITKIKESKEKNCKFYYRGYNTIAFLKRPKLEFIIFPIQGVAKYYDGGHDYRYSDYEYKKIIDKISKRCFGKPGWYISEKRLKESDLYYIKDWLNNIMRWSIFIDPNDITRIYEIYLDKANNNLMARSY